MHLQGDGDQILGSDHPSGNRAGGALVRDRRRCLERRHGHAFSILGRKKLNRNTFYKEKLSFKVVSAGFQVGEDFPERLKGRRWGWEQNEAVQVNRIKRINPKER